MEEKSPSALQSTLFYGLLLSLGMILLHLAFYLLDMHKKESTLYITLVVILAGVVLATLDYRNKKLGGFISYGRAVKIGFLTVLFASIVVAIYTYIFYIAISPGDLQEMRIERAQDIYNAGMDPEQEATALKMLDVLISPLVTSVMAVFYYTFMGILITLFTSIFLKKDESISLS